MNHDSIIGWLTEELFLEEPPILLSPESSSCFLGVGQVFSTTPHALYSSCETAEDALEQAPDMPQEGHPALLTLAPKMENREAADAWVVRNFGVATAEAILYADGYIKAFCGVATRLDHPSVAAYDQEALLKILTDSFRDEVGEEAEEDAEEFFAFNISGAWMGDTTPMFVTLAPGVSRPD